jgi:hypothetical protein
MSQTQMSVTAVASEPPRCIKSQPRLRRSQDLLGLFVALFITTTGSPALAEEEISVGHNAAGELKIQINFPLPLRLPVSVFPGMPGYVTGELGLHSAAVDDPGNDFFQLSPAADFRFILVGKDAGMEVWNDTGSAYMVAGDSFFIGTAPFDTHPLWDIVTGTPGRSYSLTIKVHDLNGIYADSAPFVLSFTPDPPVLTITPASRGFVTISWAPDTPGFVLQFKTTLSAPWSNAPSGAANPVTVPTPSPARLYRVIR